MDICATTSFRTWREEKLKSCGLTIDAQKPIYFRLCLCYLRERAANHCRGSVFSMPPYPEIETMIAMVIINAWACCYKGLTCMGSWKPHLNPTGCLISTETSSSLPKAIQLTGVRLGYKSSRNVPLNVYTMPPLYEWWLEDITITFYKWLFFLTWYYLMNKEEMYDCIWILRQVVSWVHWYIFFSWIPIKSWKKNVIISQ